MTLSEEVEPSVSTARRSQTTGHLLITMPKVLHTTVHIFHYTSIPLQSVLSCFVTDHFGGSYKAIGPVHAECVCVQKMVFGLNDLDI